MKRPEGFDQPANPPAEPNRKGAAPKAPARPADTASTAQRPKAPKRKPLRTKSEKVAAEKSKPTPEKPKPEKPKPSRRDKAAPVAEPSAEQKKAESVRAARGAARRAAKERRRFERTEVRRFTRRSRHRRLAWVSALVTVALLFGLVAIAVYSPLLELKEITIVGASRVNAEEIHTAVDDQLGTPLALIDFDKITRELSGFPLIRSYVTEAVPPHTLVISIVEREPVASIMTATGYTLVDPAGVVIQESETRPEGLPMIELAGENPGGPVFGAVVEVLLALPDSVLAQVDRVTATTLDDVTLTLGSTGQRVVWGNADRSELKARVLVQLMAQYPDSAVEFDVTAPLSAVVRPV